MFKGMLPFGQGTRSDEFRCVNERCYLDEVYLLNKRGWLMSVMCLIVLKNTNAAVIVVYMLSPFLSFITVLHFLDLLVLWVVMALQLVEGLSHYTCVHEVFHRRMFQHLNHEDPASSPSQQS